MWALTWRERIGALVVDAYGARWTNPLMHRYQENLVGEPRCFGDLENSAYALVTISKTPILVYMLSQLILFLACFGFVLHVVNTYLDELFIKTCVYTYISSELHLIIICLCLLTHLYSLHVHV